MNEQISGKALAVAAIWLASASASIFGNAGWIPFVAAGMTSYYIWIFERGAAKEDADPVAELKRWNELREQGIITQAEYDDKKADLL